MNVYLNFNGCLHFIPRVLQRSLCGSASFLIKHTWFINKAFSSIVASKDQSQRCWRVENKLWWISSNRVRHPPEFSDFSLCLQAKPAWCVHEDLQMNQQGNYVWKKVFFFPYKKSVLPHTNKSQMLAPKKINKMEAFTMCNPFIFLQLTGRTVKIIPGLVTSSILFI